MSDDQNTNRIRFTRPGDAPLRDKDNAKPELKPAHANPAPNLAPPGMSGIKARMPSQGQPEGRQAPPQELKGLAMREPLWAEKSYYTDGKVTTMPGYSFMARVTDERSEQGINGGKIDQLVLKKDDRVVARYNQGWEKDAETPEQKEAVHRVRTGLGDTEKDRAHTIAPDKGKAHDLDR